MKKFSDFGIKALAKGFIGDKIKINRILNKEIKVLDFKVLDSKFTQERQDGKCLYIQVQIGETNHVVFTGSMSLIEMIKQVPKSGFPFTAIIIKDNERLEFT